MSTSTITAPITTTEYRVVPTAPGYAVTRDGVYLTRENGSVRTFVTPNAARKRISRERTGNFHK